ncbi:hypothetical protein [Rubrobacter marinus]
MEERGIREDEVRATLERPDVEYRGSAGRVVAERMPPGRSLATKVIYNPGLEGERVVVTVERGRPSRR